MASSVDICNFALRRCGAERINSLADQTKEAIACNDAYTICKNALLAEHPWNFATRRVSLGLLVAAPLWGFDKQFQLPADCLRVIETEYDDLEGFEYRVENNSVLLCNESSIKIEYISSLTTEAQFSPKFIEALGWKLAQELSYSLVQSIELMATIENKAKLEFANARLLDAQEGSPRQLRKSDWTNERL